MDAMRLEATGHLLLHFATEAVLQRRLKSKEADYVILLGLGKGKSSLPSEIVTHPLIEALQAKAEPYPHAEERRLFYVALTRAKHRIYLICDILGCSRLCGS